MTPEELLRIYKEIRTCEDGKLLEEKWGIKDNFLVLLYDTQLPLFRTIFEAFLHSPDTKGLRDKWVFNDTEDRTRARLDYLDRNQIISDTVFYYELGTAEALIHHYLSSGLADSQFHHEGKPVTLMLSFHPYNPKEMPGVHHRVGLARGIADFVQYVAHSDITARFPAFEEAVK